MSGILPVSARLGGTDLAVDRRSVESAVAPERVDQFEAFYARWSSDALRYDWTVAAAATLSVIEEAAGAR